MSTNGDRIARLLDPFIEANKEAQVAYAALRRSVLIEGEIVPADFDKCQDALKQASDKVISAQKAFHRYFAPMGTTRLIPSTLNPDKPIAVAQTPQHYESRGVHPIVGQRAVLSIIDDPHYGGKRG
jgi:hypothetical protein